MIMEKHNYNATLLKLLMNIFSFNFWRALVLMVGTLIPLFWTYGDVCLEVVAGIQAITKIAYIHRYACT